MHNILILASDETSSIIAPLLTALESAGYTVGITPMFAPSASQKELSVMFGGRPPDVLVADLSSTPDFFPIRHTDRLLKQAWGEELPTPARLSILKSNHLDLPDWSLYTDDFLLPPYGPAEMLSRVELLLYRKRNVRSSDTLTLEDLVLDLASGRASDDSGRSLLLTPREYELLRFLVTHRGKFFARDRLLDMVWGIDFEGGERTVDIHVRRLRTKLPPRSAVLLETRRSIGYGMSSGQSRQ